MNKATTIASIFIILTTISVEIVDVSSSSPLSHENQGYEEPAGGRYRNGYVPSLKYLLQGYEKPPRGRHNKNEQEHAHEVHCSRERSRAASKIIEEYLAPFMEKENYQLPKKCRLHLDNNIFRDQEEHKIHIDIKEWRCGYCKKSFRAEKFLDQHFDNRHFNLLNVSHGKCLADLCGALHCDAVIYTKTSKTKCNPAAAGRNRHLCESLADSCFPLSRGPSASRLHELFLHQFCDAHTCSGKQKPFVRGGRKQTSIFYLAAGALTLVLLPVFYLFVYLIQRDMRSRTQELRRITKVGRKTKSS